MKDFDFDDTPNDQPIRIFREPIPFFTLRDEYFNKLKSSNEIAIYTIIEQCIHKGIVFNNVLIWEWASGIGITKRQFNNAIKALHKIGFLEKISE